MLLTEKDFLEAEIKRLKGNINTLTDILLDIYQQIEDNEWTSDIDTEDIRIFLEDEDIIKAKESKGGG